MFLKRTGVAELPGSLIWLASPRPSSSALQSQLFRIHLNLSDPKYEVQLHGVMCTPLHDKNTHSNSPFSPCRVFVGPLNEQ